MSLLLKLHVCSCSGLENRKKIVNFQIASKFSSEIQDGRQKEPMGQYFAMGTSKFDKLTY